MIKYFYLTILFLMLSCSTTKKAIAESKEQERQTIKEEKNQEEEEETTIVWHFPQDTIFQQNKAWLLNPLPLDSSTSTKHKMPSYGYIKITKKASSNDSKQEVTTSNKNQEKTSKASTQNKTTINWFLSVMMAFILLFICQCVINRKKIAKLFASYK